MHEQVVEDSSWRGTLRRAPAENGQPYHDLDRTSIGSVSGVSISMITELWQYANFCIFNSSKMGEGWGAKIQKLKWQFAKAFCCTQMPILEGAVGFDEL